MSKKVATDNTQKVATMSVVATARSAPGSNVRARITRRLSTSSTPMTPMKVCRSLSHSLEALDLSSASPTQTLASLRYLVLSYLAYLERKLSEIESPEFEPWSEEGEYGTEDEKPWVHTALEMLERIREDVCSHLPEIHFADLSSMEEFLRSHLPDLHDVRSHLPEMPHLPDMADMRSHLPDMPPLPDMTDMRSHLPDMLTLPDMDDMLSDMRHKLNDVRTRFQELDFQHHFTYIPTLTAHLENLKSHLSNSEVGTEISFGPSNVLSDLLKSVLESDVAQDIINSAPDALEQGEHMLEAAALEVAMAVKRSLQGMHLIKYSDLPHPWKNNPFVVHGYRFIPIERWPLLLLSVFKLHNETLNIHTHLIPFLLWAINLLPLFNNRHTFDTPEILFMSFALLCLLSSALWHTMSGCADHRSMEMCARIDYVGIGWLISASVGTVVHYGFRCHPDIGHWFLGLCFATGLAGNIFPFMDWFNQHEYRYYRIAFFLTLAFSGIGPAVALSFLHSKAEMHAFASPVYPSLLSYLVGLFFYAAHFPERVLPEGVRRRLDMIGGGSHAIWHCFIVLAVSQHKSAIQSMKAGIQCSSGLH
ncbi:hemolysin-III related-domain-containing protein [Panaeolus papilionaceus]|nr:hemolysin-III related-domain-containing protein [Panaeolus papilionaceus]